MGLVTVLKATTVGFNSLFQESRLAQGLTVERGWAVSSQDSRPAAAGAGKARFWVRFPPASDRPSGSFGFLY